MLSGHMTQAHAMPNLMNYRVRYGLLRVLFKRSNVEINITLDVALGIHIGRAITYTGSIMFHSNPHWALPTQRCCQRAGVGYPPVLAVEPNFGAIGAYPLCPIQCHSRPCVSLDVLISY